MKFDRRAGMLTIGAGLLLIVAVPSSEVISANLASTPPLPSITTTAPQVVAPATVEVAEAEIDETDPVQRYLKSGKPLPSYISDGGAAAPALTPAPVVTVTDRQTGETSIVPPVPTAPAASTTAPATGVAAAKPPVPTLPAVPATAPVEPEPTQVAAIEPTIVPPIPMSSEFRPKPSAVQPSVQRNVGPQAALPPVTPRSRNELEVILPAPEQMDGPDYEAYPQAAAAEEWEYGPTRDFLDQSGREAPYIVTEFANGWVDQYGAFHFWGQNRHAFRQPYVQPYYEEEDYAESEYERWPSERDSGMGLDDLPIVGGLFDR